MKPMANKEYVDRNGLLCPFCKSNNVQAWGGPELDGITVWMDVRCDNCGKDWQDVYRLARYSYTPDDEPVEA